MEFRHGEKRIKRGDDDCKSQYHRRINGGMHKSAKARMSMERLNTLLEFLEENIDLNHLKEVENLHLDTIEYRQVSYLPLSVSFPPDGEFTPFPYAEAFEDSEKMLFNELLGSFSSIYNSIRLKDHFPLHIRSNHGIGILASLLGANCKIINNNMPWVDHLEIKEIKSLIARGVPDICKNLGKKVIETCKYFNDKLREYPKCFQAIHISQPDLQGPFDIAHLLIGGDIFYKVYDEPEMLRQLLEIITETYISFRKSIDNLLTHQAGKSAVYVHGCIYGGKVIIKDDTAAINLSREMYNEFAKLYNERILEAFGGGSLHYCGEARKWHFESINSKWLKGINYGNPEMHNLKNSYEFWSRNKIPILWWGNDQNHEFLDEVYRLKIPTGITLATEAESFSHAREILKNHIERTASP